MSAAPDKIKFTPANVEKILNDIAEYTPYKIAAESNGVSHSALKDWIAKGTKDLEDEKDTEFARLVTSIRTIEKKRIRENQSKIIGNDKGHKGAEWTLERSFWQYFTPNIAERENAAAIEKLQSQINNKDKSDAEVRSEG